MPSPKGKGKSGWKMQFFAGWVAAFQQQLWKIKQEYDSLVDSWTPWPQTASVLVRMGLNGFSCMHLAEMWVSYRPLGDLVEGTFKFQNVVMLWPSNSTSLYRSKRPEEAHSRMFITTLLQSRTQPKCWSIRESPNKLCLSMLWNTMQFFWMK